MKTETKKKIRATLRILFNIRADMAEPEEIRNRIKANSEIHGTNMYVLIAAIIIASIGLNMNSTAVIIGAMLISPLMGSIIGTGYGLATKQTRFTRQSFENLMTQILIAFGTSTIYFLFSPITAASDEILARTSPTVWDVLIAVFGGAAGIIGQTRKEKSNNIIPGVAIATALMPPLCTAGYGLANGKWTVMLGALDLFLVNCLCIFAMTFLFTKLMKIDDTPDDMKTSGRLGVWVAVLAVLVFLPTGFFAYDYVANQAQESRISTFVNETFSFDDTQVIRYSYDDDTNILTVTLVGRTVDDETIENIKSEMDGYGLGDVTLKITQTETEKTISIEEVDDLIDKKLKEIEERLSAVEEENSSLAEENSSLSDEVSALSEENISEPAAGESTTAGGNTQP